MPDPTSKSSKLSLSKLVMMLVVAVAAFLELRFVFSVAMSVLKFVALAGLAVLVVYLFLAKDKGSGKSG